MPAIQDFSIPAGNAMDVYFAMDPTDVINIGLDALIRWQVYPQSAGVPDQIDGPLIAKDTVNGGIDIPGSPAETFVVHLLPGDTAGFYPGNAYHEALVIDANGNPTTVTVGVMTITQTLVPVPSGF
jgi:hypothetical protein